MYKNMKIAITDEVQLNAVCEVLESMNYTKLSATKSKPSYVIVTPDGYYSIRKAMAVCNTTLTDLLALRDKQFMEKLNAAD